MSISRDRRAPTELNSRQLDEVKNHPDLVALRTERTECKVELHAQGYNPLRKAKGTDLYKKYVDTNLKAHSTYQKLHRERLAAAIREFHDTIDSIEIAKQLGGKAATEVLTLPAVEFELKERATIASMLFQPFRGEEMHVQFVSALIKLGHKQETRRPKAVKRKMDMVVRPYNQVPSPNKRSYYISTSSLYAFHQEDVAAKTEPTPPPHDEVLEELYPKVLGDLVCLICIGNSERSDEWRLRRWERKDVLKKHIESHFKDHKFRAEFSCRHPKCHGVMLDGIMHFMRHALDDHGVSH